MPSQTDRQFGSPACSSHETILVVEDSLVLQLLIVKQLLSLGKEAHAVSNGQAAIEAVKAGSFALILMDCQMPILDGCGATKAIRQFESATQMHTPIIAMTASNLESDLKLCLAAGMDDIIEKPFTPAQLNQKITSWLCS